MAARPVSTGPESRLVLVLAALALVLAHPVSATENVLPTNLPWADDVQTLAAHALADARAAAAVSATTTGFVVARKQIARELVAAASATASGSPAAPSATAFTDTVLHQLKVLTHNRLALIIGCSVALALVLVGLLLCCCRRRGANPADAGPTTPFADRATSLPTSKGRRRSYKTLHD